MTESEVDAAVLDRIAAAIEAARCPHREGPFGGYDYGHNPAFYGPEPEGGRYVVRDFRDPHSPDWGKWVHQTGDRAEHELVLERMTQRHIARAAYDAARPDAALLEYVARLEAALEPFTRGPDRTSLAKLYAHLNRDHYRDALAALASKPERMGG